MDELLSFCIEEKIPPVEDALHEVKVMAARLRKRAEDIKEEINSVADECVKRILGRKDEMMAQVGGTIMSCSRMYIFKNCRRTSGEALERNCDRFRK